jgi:acyl-CoA thioesterase-1
MRRFAILFAFVLLVAPAFGAVAQANVAPVLLVVGDSISAGYGLAQGESWVDLLGARLPAQLREHRPAIVVIERGGTDALRGGKLDATRANLDAMVKAALAAHAKVLVLGMQVPPNYGSAYARRFEGVFTEVAKANRVAVVPYLFAGFGDDLAHFQPDRIHPKADAEPRILDNVWPA